MDKNAAGPGPHLPHSVLSDHVENRHMSIRTRKLIGTVLLFVLVAAWALLAMALAQSVLTSASPWLALAYYVAAGLGWVVPAMPLIRWMQRPDRAAEKDS
jgi:hypothetical protein